MGVGQWVKSVGVSDASLGRRDVKIDSRKAVVSWGGAVMGIIGPHKYHISNHGYICQTQG